MTQLQTLIEEIPKYQPGADLDVLARAYQFSAASHQGQQRASGEPYLSHPLEVANLLVAFKMDVTTVTAGLLHDVLEDTTATKRRSRARVRRRDRRARRRRHEDRQARLLVARRAPGRDLPEDAGGDGARPPRAHDQARRSSPQHAHPRLPAGRQVPEDRAGDARHLRAPGPSARHGQGEGGARGPRPPQPQPDRLPRSAETRRQAPPRARGGHQRR